MKNPAVPPHPLHEKTRLALLIQLLKLASMISAPMADGVCDPAGIASNELRVMMALRGEGALAGHDFSEIVGLTPMNVSRALASLRNRGWIEPAHDPANRRRRPVRLTKSGAEALERMMPDVAAVAEALLGGMAADRLAELAGSLAQITERVSDWITSHHAEVKLRR